MKKRLTVFLTLMILTFSLFFTFALCVNAEGTEQNAESIDENVEIEEKSWLAEKFESITAESIVACIFGVLGSTTGTAILIYFVKKAIEKLKEIFEKYINDLLETKTNADNNITFCNTIIENIASVFKDETDKFNKKAKKLEDTCLKFLEENNITREQVENFKNTVAEKVEALENTQVDIFEILRLSYTNNSKLVTSGVAEEIEKVVEMHAKRKNNDTNNK